MNNHQKFNASYIAPSVGNPQVYIALNNNRIKEYERNNEKQIFLKDGSEFQLEFFNDSHYYVKAEISINGKLQSAALVLRPHQRFYLDRFMDDKKKFKFNTFMTGADEHEKLKEIIKKNGLIEVKFYKELTPFTTTWQYGNSWCNTAIGGTSNPSYDSNLSSSTQIKTAIENYFDKISCDSSNKLETLSAKFVERETGRIEEGNKSKQKFVATDMSWEIYPIKSISYHILPISEKPKKNKRQKNVIAIDDIRSYCPTCGRRIKKGYNFCPGCGEKF